MTEFSIIVPVYNAEKTIERCLNSVQTQIFKDYEVLMIDDGSSDCSADVCKQYAKQDHRFRYLYQNNSGPSAARNLGLDSAEGRVIVFLDSDDYFGKDALEVLHCLFSTDEVDIVFHSYNQVDEAGRIIEKKNISEIPVDTWEAIQFLTEQDMYGYTWIKSIKKSIIANIRFREDINLFEDEILICDLLSNRIRIGYTDYPIIDYVVNNENALTGRTHQDYCVKRELVYQAWRSMAQRFGRSENEIISIANKSLMTCKYYYLERNVNLLSFIDDLRKTTFVRRANIDPRFSKLVLSRKYLQLFLLRSKYRVKVRLSHVMRGKRNE